MVDREVGAYIVKVVERTIYTPRSQLKIFISVHMKEGELKTSAFILISGSTVQNIPVL